MCLFNVYSKSIYPMELKFCQVFLMTRPKESFWCGDVHYVISNRTSYSLCHPRHDWQFIIYLWLYYFHSAFKFSLSWMKSIPGEKISWVKNCPGERMSWVRNWRVRNCRVRKCRGWETDGWEIVVGEKLTSEKLSCEKMSWVRNWRVRNYRVRNCPGEKMS